jgi:3-dehydroquinate synthase
LNLLDVSIPFSFAWGGGGGSYGGLGGKGYGLNPIGSIYNDKLLTDLLGGSGGSMRSFDLYEINSSSGNYKIEVGENLIEKVTSFYNEAIYIVDSKLVDRLPSSITKRIVIEAIEENKALEKSTDYISQLRKLNANRDTHLVAVGGGIVQDITTFVASIYMRGIPWTYLPTTVLSMADSCIGGKSSINVHGYKNLIGNFYPPKDIYIDLSFIKTLDEEMIVGGLFEAAKICYAKDPSVFKAYKELKPSAHASLSQMRAIIGLALSAKKWFIEIDEFDQKERLLLNFGHTFGHAIESSTNFEVHHGIGVGAGMLIAAVYAKISGLLTRAGELSVEPLVEHVEAMLTLEGERFIGAPRNVDINSTLEKFHYDKKHKTDFFRMIVPGEDGNLKLISVARNSKEQEKIKVAFIAGFKLLNWNYH